MKSKILFAIILLILLVTAIGAQQAGEISFKDDPTFPPGAMGERVRSVIATVNSGDFDRIRGFINNECTEKFRFMVPMDQHIGVFMNFLAQTGGIDFAGIRSYVPPRQGQTVVIVKDRNFDSFGAITLGFSQDPKLSIDAINFGAARNPPGNSEPPLSEGEVVSLAKALLDKLIAKGAFSGSFLLAKNSQVLISAAGGEASKAFHVANNIDTKFNLGSMNKMFTSTSVMRLVEQGRLSLDDPLSKFLDDSWLPKSVTQTITIRHLLSHSSGLGNYFNEAYDKSSRLLFRKLDDYKPLIKDDRPAFTPGSRFQYSNTGMFLLGVVIEKVTGQDYFEHIRQVIYAPAGMKNSDCYEMDTPVENLAIGYSRDFTSPTGWRNNLYSHVVKGGPAGGGFSTAPDLHRFALALLAGKLVSKESLKTMWTDHLKARYGFGFQVNESPSGLIVGHSGGFEGINSQLDIHLESGTIVAVMSNVNMGASPIARKLTQWLVRIQRPQKLQ